MRQQRRSDGGVVCVCFAVLGVPLGSTAWRVEGTGRGGSESFSGGSIITLPPQMVLMCVYICVCLPFFSTRINVSTQRLYSCDGG